MDIRNILHQYIHVNYLKGDSEKELKYDTPLLSSGIIDSIGVMGLINYIESTFSIEFNPRELDRENLETIDRMHDSILKKISVSDN